MSTKETKTPQAAAEIPQPDPTLTPEAVIEQLRNMRAKIGEVTPLSAAQRRLLHNRARTSNPVLQASINVIGAFENVSLAVGQPAEQVRRLHEEANRWTAVEDELRTMLSGVAGANLIRRQRVALVAAQAAIIGAQLARDPANALLLPHVQEVRRLKSFARRKKTVQPETPPAEPAPSESAKG